MTNDKILQMFFEKERWTYAIDKGVGKDINKGQLYQLTKPEVRAKMYQAIANGNYVIAPPHTAKIPKDTPGEFRTVYVNEPIDRIFLSIANDLLIDLTPEMIHPACQSYQRGIGCGKIVQNISKKICSAQGDVIGWKSDLSKYFDSVPIEFIDQAFNRVEEKHGHSAIIDVLRKYYHSNLYFDEKGNLLEAYQSLKQGCSVASWLANVLLYHIDEKLSSMDGEYVRYSDDMLYIGTDYEAAMQVLCDGLSKMQMRLNPKKVEYLTHSRWFKFLGFSIKGRDISISKNRIKTFQKEIEKRTIKHRGISLKQAVNAVNGYLYKGDGLHSWATQILPVCNVRKDIDTLNMFVMDCLRAVQTKRGKLGGLGYDSTRPDGCVVRGTGKNVKANRAKTAKEIPGYLTLGCMQNALLTRRAVYNTLVASL
jgi:hypothetical protein